MAALFAVFTRMRKPNPDRYPRAVGAIVSTLTGVETKAGSASPTSTAPCQSARIRARKAINMAPIHDAAAAVTLCADVSNVDTVIVDGVVRKRGGKLVADVARARQLVESSKDYLLGAVAAAKAAAPAAS